MWKLYRWLRFRETSERNFKVDFQLTIEYNVFKTGEAGPWKAPESCVLLFVGVAFFSGCAELNTILSGIVVSGTRIAKRITCVVSTSLLSLFCLWTLSRRLLFLFYAASPADFVSEPTWSWLIFSYAWMPVLNIHFIFTLRLLFSVLSKIAGLLFETRTPKRMKTAWFTYNRLKYYKLNEMWGNYVATVFLIVTL